MVLQYTAIVVFSVPFVLHSCILYSVFPNFNESENNEFFVFKAF